MLWLKKHSCGEEATAADVGTDPITVAEAPPADDPMPKFSFCRKHTLGPKKERKGGKGKEKKRKKLQLD